MFVVGFIFLNYRIITDTSSIVGFYIIIIKYKFQLSSGCKKIKSQLLNNSNDVTRDTGQSNEHRTRYNIIDYIIEIISLSKNKNLWYNII